MLMSEVPLSPWKTWRALKGDWYQKEPTRFFTDKMREAICWQAGALIRYSCIGSYHQTQVFILRAVEFPVFHWRKVKTSSFFRFFEKWVSFSELCEELSAYSAISGSMWLTHFLPRTKWTHIKGFKRGFGGVSGGSTLIKSSSSSQMCRLCHKMTKAELININWDIN